MSLAEPKVTCLFVHGWGMNSRIWQPVLDKLPAWVDAHVMDLPGHGQRTEESISNFKSLTEDLLIQCKKINKRRQTEDGAQRQPLILIGWSLGGLPCLQLAINQTIDQSREIDGVMLVSSNPCFVSRENWSCGIDGEVFNQFSQSLKTDFSGTIRRFLSLQVKGSDSGRVILRSLREKVLQQPQPNEVSLDAGLALLQQVDLRDQIKQISLPVSWVLGEQDGLVKAELAEELENVTVIKKAGHAAFLSHTEEFIKQLIKTLQAHL